MDFSYLENFAQGDSRVVREVLGLFQEQAAAWRQTLAHGGDQRDVVHTMKGSSRGVGATALGDACEQAERAGLSDLSGVRAALDATSADIAAYLAKGAA